MFKKQTDVYTYLSHSMLSCRSSVLVSYWNLFEQEILVRSKIEAEALELFFIKYLDMKNELFSRTVQQVFFLTYTSHK